MAERVGDKVVFSSNIWTKNGRLPRSFSCNRKGKGKFSQENACSECARANDADDPRNYAQQGCPMQNREMTLKLALFLSGAGGVNSSAQRFGYGNCQRLVGKSFTNILHRYQGEYVLTTMDVHVFPPTGYKEDEVFKVSLKGYAQPEDKVWLTSYTRQSRYSKFESCADKSVDVRLCACAKEKTAGTTKRGASTRNRVPHKMFGSETIVKDLDSGCLLFLRRNHGITAVAAEVTNVCENRIYKFKLDGWGTERLFSKTLPINVELSPKTFYFLTSITKYAPKFT